MADRIIVLFALLLALVYFYATSKIPSLDSGDPLGPRAFPIVLGIGLVVAAVLLVAEIYRGRRHVREEKEKSKGEKRKLQLLGGGVVVWTALFIIVFNSLGYMLSMAFYLFGLMSFLNPQKWWTNAITSTLFTVGIDLLFVKVLGVELAPGIMHF